MKQELKEQLERAFDYCEHSNNYSTYKFKYEEEVFNVGIRKRPDYFEVNCYVQFGATCLIYKHIIGDDVEQAYDALGEIIEDWIDGYFHCSDCGTKTKYEDRAGGYFAATYCKECWGNKWKAVADHESYE